MSDTMQEQVEDMAMQEYFDETIRHLFDQRVRAYSYISGCQYETPEGLKCAVGCHIPEGHRARWAVGDVYDLDQNYPSLAGTAWPDTHDGLPLASELQNLHDITTNWDQENGFVGWSRAKEIADAFDLSDGIIQELKGK